VATILEGFRYTFHIIFHPFDGFWDMRHEKRGNLISTFILYGLFIESMLILQQYGGFLMYDFNPRTYNVFRSIVAIVVPLILWCVSNWCFTALTDGEGRFIDIIMATGYALFPVTITNMIGTLLSNVVIQNEFDFVNMIYDIGILWSALLIFCGVATIHQFTAKKTIFTIIITISGMFFIVFLSLLFGSIIDKLMNFVLGLITEIKLRM
jgi:hypothetical protein